MKKLCLIAWAICLLGGLGPVAAQVTLDPSPATITRVEIGGRDKCGLGGPFSTTESALELAAPIIAELGGKLIESGSELLAEYLNGIVKDESTYATLNVDSLYFYKVRKGAQIQWTAAPAVECVVIARGKRGPLDAVALASSAGKMDPRGRFHTVDAQHVIDFPVLRELGFAEYPDMYVELAVESDAFQSVIRLRPRVIYYRQTRVKLPPNKQVDLNIVLSFAAPGGASLGILPIHFSSLQPGVDYALDKLSFDNPWLPVPKPPDTKWIASHKLGKFLSETDATPINVTASVEETGTSSRFILFLSRALASANQDIGKTSEQAISRAQEGSSKGPAAEKSQK